MHASSPARSGVTLATAFTPPEHGRLVVIAMVVPVAVMGQNSTAKGKAWIAPRTGDGQPDLQGVWANNVATPMQRPKALEGKAVLSDQEVAALKAAAAELFNGDGDAAFG